MNEFGPKPGPAGIERPLPIEPHDGRSAAKKTATSHGRLQPPLRESENITLQPEQKKYLLMHIHEVPQPDIRAALEKTEYKYATFQKELWETLGADSVLNAILISIDRGGLTKEEVLEGFDRQRYLMLSPTDKETLEKLTENFGRGFTQKKAADDLKISPKSFERRMTSIQKKLGTKTQEHAAAIFMASDTPSHDEIAEGIAKKLEQRPEKLNQRDTQILLLKAKGVKNEQIAEGLQSTELAIKSRLTEIYKALEASTATQAIVHGIHLEKINPQAILEDRDIAIIDTLNVDETQVMVSMIAAGSRGTNKQITEATRIGNTKVNEHLRAIGTKLRTNNRFHSAAIFAAATRLQTNAQS